MALSARLVSFFCEASVAIHYKSDVARYFAAFQHVIKEITNATSLLIAFACPKHFLRENAAEISRNNFLIRLYNIFSILKCQHINVHPLVQNEFLLHTFDLNFSIFLIVKS